MWSFAAVTHLHQGLNCCAQKRSSACLCCNKWICELMLPIILKQSGHSRLTCLQQGIFTHRIAAYWIFSLFSYKPLRRLWRKILVDQQHLKNTDQLLWHKQPEESLNSPFVSILMFSFNFSRSPCPRLYA